MVDTETAGDIDNPFVYDMGCAVVTRKGEIIETMDCIVYEVFYGMKEKMQSAYYANKLPDYRNEIWEGTREVVEMQTMKKRVAQLIKKYDIKAICAHNARFDIKALNNTIAAITNDKTRYFFPYGIEVWDTLKMAQQIFKEKKSYTAFCEKYQYMTNHQIPRPRYTAEVIYRFITLNTSFTEAHTGLRDVEIETQILAYFFRQHKKMDKVLYHARPRA